MGCVRTDVVGGSEVTVDTQGRQIANIPPNAAEGQMTFIKVSSGDSVFIAFKNKKATSLNYDIVLTDSVPIFTEDGLVVGDIWATGSAATSRLSSYISMKLCP